MKRVMVFGTFDIVHPGHLNLFRQARKLGDYLIVVVARDESVKKAKGHTPKHSEKDRAAAVRKTALVDKAILGSRTHNFYRTLRTHQVDVIVLGYDQKPTAWVLKKDLRKHRLGGVKIIRLRPYRPDIYKSSKLA